MKEINKIVIKDCILRAGTKITIAAEQIDGLHLVTKIEGIDTFPMTVFVRPEEVEDLQEEPNKVKSSEEAQQVRKNLVQHFESDQVKEMMASYKSLVKAGAKLLKQDLGNKAEFLSIITRYVIIAPRNVLEALLIAVTQEICEDLAKKLP
jgi:hypothetical protein